MAGNDVVKLEIYRTGIGGSITVVTSRDNADGVLEAFHGTVDRFISISGRLNDADNNRIDISFKRDAIGGIVVVDTNRDF